MSEAIRFSAQVSKVTTLADGVHLPTASHAMYAAAVKTILGVS